MRQDLQPIEVPRAVPALLGFVAGYVDSCTFLALFGEFVAQVTGSFVLAGTQLVKHETGAIAKLIAIPVFFLAGFVVTMLAHLMARRGRSALTASLATECALLIGFLATLAAGTPLRGPDAPLALAAVTFGIAAMGVQSALVRLLMRGVASTNVMTTNTTQFAIDSAELLLDWRAQRRGGGEGPARARYRAARRRVAILMPIGLCFFLGTALGAVAYVMLGLRCVLLPIAIVAALTAWSGLRRPVPHSTRGSLTGREKGAAGRAARSSIRRWPRQVLPIPAHAGAAGTAPRSLFCRCYGCAANALASG